VPNINRVVLEGELLTDPVMDGGCCRLTLLVVTMRKEKEGWVGRPNHFEVVAWGAAAEEAMGTLRPGHPVGIEGELAWESDVLDDSTRRQRVWIVADKVRALDTRAALLVPAPGAQEDLDGATQDAVPPGEEPQQAAA